MWEGKYKEDRISLLQKTIRSASCNLGNIHYPLFEIGPINVCSKTSQGWSLHNPQHNVREYLRSGIRRIASRLWQIMAAMTDARWRLTGLGEGRTMIALTQSEEEGLTSKGLILTDGEDCGLVGREGGDICFPCRNVKWKADAEMKSITLKMHEAWPNILNNSGPTCQHNFSPHCSLSVTMSCSLFSSNEAKRTKESLERLKKGRKKTWMS